jgi:putative colanic acid biosynthesis glycosyltransferase
VLNDINGLILCSDSIGLSKGEFEHVIVDGDSSDGSLEYGQQLASRPHTRLIKQKTPSIYGAFNDGLNESRGQYIIYLHCGDTLNIDVVMNLVRDYKDYDLIACSCSQREGEITNVYYRSERDAISVSSMSILQPSLIIRLDKYRKVGGFDDSFKISADVDCVLKILKTECNVIYVDALVVNMDEFSVSSKNYFKKIREHMIIKYRHSGIASAIFYIVKRVPKDFLVIPLWKKIKLCLRRT